jgi:ADP-heptose:LPS heptosyltransferase
LPDGDRGALAITARAVTPLTFGRPYVVVHPGASVPARAVDAELGAAAVNLLADDGWVVAVTGTAAERALTARVAGRARAEVFDLAGRTDLAQLASLLAGASAVVCGNTGPAHLAAAVGAPVVSVFAPVVPAARWRPWGVPYVVLGAQHIECAGCRARECPRPGQPCTAGISAHDIAHAVCAVAHADRPLEVAR